MRRSLKLLIVACATLAVLSMVALHFPLTTALNPQLSHSTQQQSRGVSEERYTSASKPVSNGYSQAVPSEPQLPISNQGNRSRIVIVPSTTPAVSTFQTKRCNEKLYTPTFVTYVPHLQSFAIVDCWHHRVIFSKNIDSPIREWQDLLQIAVVSSSAGAAPSVSVAQDALNALKIPHSLATNGEILVTESSVGGSNGVNHSVLVFRFVETTGGLHSLEFLHEVHACDGNRARRPHRVIYDAASDSFFLYLTSPAFLSRFVWNRATQRLERVACQSLPFMKGMYARSIIAANGSLYITAGPGVIWRTMLDGASGLVAKKQAFSIKPLGFVKGKMNDLAYIDGWWYATSTVPCAMVRFRDIERLWDHEKIHSTLQLCKSFSRREERCVGGTPYFVSKIGSRVVVPYIFGCSGVVSFQVNPESSAIEDVRQHWGNGWVEDDADLQCRGAEW